MRSKPVGKKSRDIPKTVVESDPYLCNGFLVMTGYQYLVVRISEVVANGVYFNQGEKRSIGARRKMRVKINTVLLLSACGLTMGLDKTSTAQEILEEQQNKIPPTAQRTKTELTDIPPSLPPSLGTRRESHAGRFAYLRVHER